MLSIIAASSEHRCSLHSKEFAGRRATRQEKCSKGHFFTPRDAQATKAHEEKMFQPQVFMYEMISARSLSFLRPANTIFVPGMYFLGLIKYSNICLSVQVMPEFLLASEYAKPS
mmetsp:Transcript_88152/g.138075  ORF Transcript_88152/g.138075 Transcript_88152/m.138075 type:complete len:114 (-) Transcript_88152:214-555(-)